MFKPLACTKTFSVVGTFWLIYLLDYNMSVAVWIGLIALAGLDAETGMVMLLYLDIAYEEWQNEGRMRNGANLREAIYHGAVKRLRPKVMTVSTTFFALVPIMWSTGTGAEVMKRIAVPMAQLSRLAFRSNLEAISLAFLPFKELAEHCDAPCKCGEAHSILRKSVRLPDPT